MIAMSMSDDLINRAMRIRRGPRHACATIPAGIQTAAPHLDQPGLHDDCLSALRRQPPA